MQRCAVAHSRSLFSPLPLLPLGSVHTVMFPATLLAAAPGAYTLLHHVSCTEYLNYEGSKFSKSRNTGVFGDDAIDSGIPSEVWRYYLLYNRPEQADTVFLWEDFAAKNNAELLNNLGNFINRTLSFLHTKCGNVVPAPRLLEADAAFLQEVSALKAEYIDLLEHVRIKDGLKCVMALSKKANQFMQDNKPWELFKADRPRCDTILFLSVNLISTLAVMLEPYMPSLAEKINLQLNQQMLARGALDAADAASATFQLLVSPGHVLGTPSVLFRKIEDEEIAQLRMRFGGAVVEKKGVS
jgi:methionyl-tRNA synthetase